MYKYARSLDSAARESARAYVPAALCVCTRVHAFLCPFNLRLFILLWIPTGLAFHFVSTEEERTE